MSIPGVKAHNSKGAIELEVWRYNSTDQNEAGEDVITDRSIAFHIVQNGRGRGWIHLKREQLDDLLDLIRERLEEK